jgi:hypothetical protein
MWAAPFDKSVTENGHTLSAALPWPTTRLSRPDGKQNRNYRWHRSPTLGHICGPGRSANPGPFAVGFAQVAPRGVLLPGVGYLPTLAAGRNVGERERIKTPL